MDGDEKAGRTKFASLENSPSELRGEGGELGGEPITHLALSRWMTRDEMSQFLGVSDRTIQKRVRSEDILRREDPDRPRFKLLDTSWTQARLKRVEVGRNGGEPGAGEGANSGGEVRPPLSKMVFHLQESLASERARIVVLERELEAKDHELMSLQDQYDVTVVELEMLRQHQQNVWWRLLLLGCFGWLKRFAARCERHLKPKDNEGE